MRTGIVWLDGSRTPDKPIRRRWRIYVGDDCVLSIPMRTVPWSRERRMRKWIWKLSMKWIRYALRFAPHGPNGFAVLDLEDRWALHVMACAPPMDGPAGDYTFWIQLVDEDDFGYWVPDEIKVGDYKATECETGVSAFGKTPLEAVTNYFNS